MQIGIGYDVHSLIEGRQLVLGGVDIPYNKGLNGWSDADVLTHAIIDALLGAAALGDIGSNFPPGEPQYKDISSLILLSRVNEMLLGKGWRINNIDATIIAERPKLNGFIKQMRQKLADTVGISAEQVSVKASTSDGLGFTGRGEGLAALAMASIERTEPKSFSGRA